LKLLELLAELIDSSYLDHSLRLHLHLPMTILVSGATLILLILHECMPSWFVRNDDGARVLIGMGVDILPFHIPKNVSDLVLLQSSFSGWLWSLHE
jgi:hypothetical protein